MWPVSLVGILSTAVVCGTDMFFLTIAVPRSDWLHHLLEPRSWDFSTCSRCADADLRRLGDHVQLLAGRVKQEWNSAGPIRIALNAELSPYLAASV